MRIRHFVLLISATMAAAGFVANCGGTTTDNGPADAGQDVSTDHTTAPDAVADVAIDTATCDKSADLTKGIPDASLADGATSTGICLGCIDTFCQKQLAACDQDCDCQNAARDGLDCVLKNAANVFACVGSFTGLPASAQAEGMAFGGCVQSKCMSVCAPNLDGGLDGDAGDAADGD